MNYHAYIPYRDNSSSSNTSHRKHNRDIFPKVVSGTTTCVQGLKWLETRERISRSAISLIWCSQTSQGVFFRRNARSEAGKMVLSIGTQDPQPQWTSQSEFRQVNDLTKNTGGRWKIERSTQILQGPKDIYRSHSLPVYWLVSAFFDFMLIWLYVAVIVWFRPSCIRCVFRIFKIFFTFCIFAFYTFPSAVLLFYGGQFNRFVPFW